MEEATSTPAAEAVESGAPGTTDQASVTDGGTTQDCPRGRRLRVENQNRMVGRVQFGLSAHPAYGARKGFLERIPTGVHHGRGGKARGNPLQRRTVYVGLPRSG